MSLIQSEVDDAFWCVWNFCGHAPTVQHQSEAEAITEAGRLARLNPAQKFYVLRAIERIEVQAVTRTRLMMLIASA